MITVEPSTLGVARPLLGSIEGFTPSGSLGFT